MVREHADKFSLVTAEYFSLGVDWRLPITQPWPELLQWKNNTWERSAMSGFNVFKMMHIAEDRGYKSPFWLSLKDGEAAGGHLKEGAKGVESVSWRWSPTSENWKGDLNSKNATGVEKEIDDVGIENTTVTETSSEQKNLAVAMRPKVLFNRDEWLGVEDENWPTYLPRELPSTEEALARCEKIEKDGAACEIRHSDGPAYYNPSLHYISIAAKERFKSLKEYYLELFEQIGHAAASKNDLNLWDGPTETNMSKDPSFKKLYAKMVAAMLAYEAGVDVL
jgi:antirestriction protein ArdC